MANAPALETDMDLNRELSQQVPDLCEDHLLHDDRVLMELVQEHGLDPRQAGLDDYGRELGRAERRELGRLANLSPPVLESYSRQGRRVDQVHFHAAWHELMAMGIHQGLHLWPQLETEQAHLGRAIAFFMHGQIEAGTLCPLTMTRAAAPLLQVPELEPLRTRLSSRVYDPAPLPIMKKRGMLVGMGMTEMQGGSDLRGCTTWAQADGPGVRIYGHKWFFSVPQADAHLVLAREDEALSCFLLPRWTEEGLNGITIRRLKDKLGNRSNASAEVEFDGAYGHRLGQAGRGIALLVGMASRTRVDCVLGSAALIRQASVQAIHYCMHRRAFGRNLIHHELMRDVLADMALESEASTRLAMFLVCLQHDPRNERRQAVLRVLAPAAKFWVCRRAMAVCSEALETWGGNGYIEDGPMPRLLREAPVNSIWEGSGNVMCLDVLRALAQPGVGRNLWEDLEQRCEGDSFLSRRLDGLRAALPSPEAPGQARLWAQNLVLLYQACLLREQAPDFVADGFLAWRLEHCSPFFSSTGWPHAYTMLERAWPYFSA